MQNIHFDDLIDSPQKFVRERKKKNKIKCEKFETEGRYEKQSIN